MTAKQDADRSGRLEQPPSRGRDAGQLALFDVGLVPSLGDPRSVGELLEDVDRQARDLLFDVSENDAAGLLRGWPELARSASRLWIAIPGRPTDDFARDNLDRPMARVEAMSRSIEQAVETRVWPGPGPTHTAFAEWAAMLDHAARLVQRYAPEIPVEQTRVRRDLDATRARLAHGLYVSSHAIAVALDDRKEHLTTETGGVPRNSGPQPARTVAMLVKNTDNWARRIRACERSLSKPRGPRHGNGPVQATDPGHTQTDVLPRFARALASWDIQAHRTLAINAAPVNVHLVCRVQHLISSSAATVFRTSESHPSLTTPALDVMPTIEQSIRAWSNLANRWHDLVSPINRLDPALARAASEVRTASGLAIPCDLDKAGARVALTDAIIAAAELAPIVAERALDTTLRGPARPLSRRAHDEAEAGIENGCRLDADIVWVRSTDIQNNAQVLLPAPVLDGLRHASIDATRCATLARAITEGAPSFAVTDSIPRLIASGPVDRIRPPSWPSGAPRSAVEPRGLGPSR
jgi:hypothetical protein